jgi:hypothetical protein
MTEQTHEETMTRLHQEISAEPTVHGSIVKLIEGIIDIFYWNHNKDATADSIAANKSTLANAALANTPEFGSITGSHTPATPHTGPAGTVAANTSPKEQQDTSPEGMQKQIRQLEGEVAALEAELASLKQPGIDHEPKALPAPAEHDQAATHAGQHEAALAEDHREG